MDLFTTTISFVLKRLLATLYRCVSRLEVYGLDHVPKRGACLLVFNHLSNYDPHLIYSLVERTDLTGLHAADYRRRPFHRFMVEAAGGRWIRRGAADRAALQTALGLLDRGWIVGIAPEGRRSPNAGLLKAKRGAAFLALRAGVPVLPIALTGTEHLHRSIPRLQRAHVTVRIGEPFMIPASSSGNHRRLLQDATNLIMCRLAEQLPVSYRGEYGGQPVSEHVHSL